MNSHFWFRKFSEWKGYFSENNIENFNLVLFLGEIENMKYVKRKIYGMIT